MGTTTKHTLITTWLRQTVGRSGPGTLLPTICEVQDRFGVGIATVVRAYELLKAEGLVVVSGHPMRYTVTAGR